MPWTTHSCPHPTGKPGLAQTSHLCDSFPSLSVQKPCGATDATCDSPTSSSAWRWHTGPCCRCPDRASPLQLGSEVTAIVCYWPKRKKKTFGELPKSKRRCMRWLESATIHQDSAESLGNVFGNFIFLWPFVIIDCQRPNHSSQQEMAPDASCSSSWIALNQLLK